ncbi:hypothetical protein NQZ79_g6895 [Umbelopsis isabellina]|nr:hypothetical protein NQZ79_g6895 [Umbelopsis isabellina]
MGCMADPTGSVDSRHFFKASPIEQASYDVFKPCEITGASSYFAVFFLFSFFMLAFHVRVLRGMRTMYPNGEAGRRSRLKGG